MSAKADDCWPADSVPCRGSSPSRWGSRTTSRGRWHWEITRTTATRSRHVSSLWHVGVHRNYVSLSRSP
eukprot:scaffold9316_cov36-Prasinocladus_malaysianus.AAC.1